MVVDDSIVTGLSRIDSKQSGSESLVEAMATTGLTTDFILARILTEGGRTSSG